MDYPHRLENYLRQKVRKFTTVTTTLLRGLSQTAPFNQQQKILCLQRSKIACADIKDCRSIECVLCLLFYTRAEYLGLLLFNKGKETKGFKK